MKEDGKAIWGVSQNVQKWFGHIKRMSCEKWVKRVYEAELRRKKNEKKELDLKKRVELDYGGCYMGVT